jgi:hypothetical protein
LIDADPSPSKEGIRTVLKMLRNPELENVDPFRFIDSSFIKKATASGSKL